MSCPELNLTNLDQLRQVLVRDFHCFTNRRAIFVGLRQFFAPQLINGVQQQKVNFT